MSGRGSDRFRPIVDIGLIRQTVLMRSFILASTLLVIASPAHAADSLFAQLVEATARSDQQAFAGLLATETLSTSTITVDKNDRLSRGSMRHGVPAAEITVKLEGCTVKQWRDIGAEQREAYILWQCPSKRVPENICYFFTYRASMLDSRYYPENLFVQEAPHRDWQCGSFITPPPR